MALCGISVFAELVSLQRPLKELAIQNHQNIAPPPGNILDQMDKVLSTLTSLRLHVVHETDDASPDTEISVRHRLLPLMLTSS